MSRNPQILYNSILPLGEITLAESLDGYPGSNAVTPFTYEQARADVWEASRARSFYWSSLPSVAYPVDAVGLLWFGNYINLSGQYTGALAEMWGRVELLGSDDGVSWAVLHTYEDLRSGANYYSFDEVSYSRYQLRLSVFDPMPPSSGGAIEMRIANIMLGQRLEFERPIIRTHDPLPLNRTTEYQTNLSGSGQFLGRSISRRGVATSVDIPMMSREFARGPFQEFVEHAQRYPYYFSWNEALYPGDAGYVWTDEDIQTGYSGDGSLMSASWNMRGF